MKLAKVIGMIINIVLQLTLFGFALWYSFREQLTLATLLVAWLTWFRVSSGQIRAENFRLQVDPLGRGIIRAGETKVEKGLTRRPH